MAKWQNNDDPQPLRPPYSPPRSKYSEAPRTKQHLQEGRRRRHGAAARTRPVLGFSLVQRVQWTGNSHDALQEGMVSLEGDTASGPDKLTGFLPPPSHKKLWYNGAPPPSFVTHQPAPPRSWSHHHQSHRDTGLRRLTNDRKYFSFMRFSFSDVLRSPLPGTAT
jgi:hypothetical protein